MFFWKVIQFSNFSSELEINNKFWKIIFVGNRKFILKTEIVYVSRGRRYPDNRSVMIVGRASDVQFQEEFGNAKINVEVFKLLAKKVYSHYRSVLLSRGANRRKFYSVSKF